MKCTCGKDIATHPAEPCLDAMFAEKVVEYREYNGMWLDKNGKTQFSVFIFSPCSKIAHAMEGVQKWKDDPTPPEKLAEALFQSLDPPIFINIENRKWQYLVEDILYRIDALSLTRALIMWAMGKGE